MAFLRPLPAIAGVKYLILLMSMSGAVRPAMPKQRASCPIPLLSPVTRSPVFSRVCTNRCRPVTREKTGSQYHSLIFYDDEEQKAAALRSRDRVAASGRFRDRPVLTEILPVSAFRPAGEYHQQFYEKCGQGYGVSHEIRK